MELIDFINKEKVNKKVNSKKIFSYFNKCIIKSIIELDSKFKKIENKTNSIISGINMIYNIFFILIFYSNNIKLTIFLVERAIMLYSEFIIMSQDKNIIDELCFIPNITDAISFSYKKTIGPLNINKLNIKYDQQCIKEMAFLIKNIITSYYLETHNNLENTLFDNLNNLNNLENTLFDNLNNLENTLYELFNKLDNTNQMFIIKFINNLLQTNSNLDIVLNTITNINDYLNTNNSIDTFQHYCNQLI
mgnify:CR=1 FL=1